MKHSPTLAPPPRTSSIGDETGGNAVTSWFMTGFFAIAAGAAWWFFRPFTLDFNSPQFNPFLFVVAVLGGISLWSLAPAVRGTLAARKFGGTTFDMDGDHVALGETLTGRIRTAGDLRPTGEYRITIQCIEAVTRRSGLDHKERTTDYLRWEALRKIEPDAVRSSEGLPVEFRIPTTALAIDDARAEGQVRWVLCAGAPLPGKDFEAIFPLDVRPAGER